MKLMNLLREQTLTEAKTPAEQAHDLGLSHVGGGYWADDSGQVTARTYKGKLIKLNNPQEIPDEGDEDSEFDDEGSDLTYKEIDTQGKESLKKLVEYVINMTGIEVDDGTLPFLRNAIARSVRNKQAPDWSPMYDEIQDPDDLEDLKSVLNGIATSSSKLVRSVGMMLKQMDHHGKKVTKKKQTPMSGSLDNVGQSEENPENTTPGDEAEVQEEVGVSLDKVLEILGIDDSHSQYENLKSLLPYIDQATTGSQLNYAKKKFNALDLYDEGTNVGKGSKTWDKWKELAKYVKSTKPEYKTGAQNPGKLKGKTEEDPINPELEAVLNQYIHLSDTKMMNMGYSAAPDKIKGELKKVLAIAVTSPKQPPLQTLIAQTDLLATWYTSKQIADFNQSVMSIRKDHPEFIQNLPAPPIVKPVEKPTDDLAQVPSATNGETGVVTPSDDLIIAAGYNEFESWVYKEFGTQIADQAFKVHGLAIDHLLSLYNDRLPPDTTFKRQMLVAVANSVKLGSVQPIKDLVENDTIFPEEAEAFYTALKTAGISDTINPGSPDLTNDDNFGAPEDLINAGVPEFMKWYYQEFEAEKQEIAELYGEASTTIANQLGGVTGLKLGTPEGNKILAALGHAVRTKTIDSLWLLKEKGIGDPNAIGILIDTFVAKHDANLQGGDETVDWDDDYPVETDDTYFGVPKDIPVHYTGGSEFNNWYKSTFDTHTRGVAYDIVENVVDNIFQDGITPSWNDNLEIMRLVRVAVANSLVNGNTDAIQKLAEEKKIKIGEADALIDAFIGSTQPGPKDQSEPRNQSTPSITGTPLPVSFNDNGGAEIAPYVSMMQPEESKDFMKRVGQAAKAKTKGEFQNAFAGLKLPSITNQEDLKKIEAGLIKFWDAIDAQQNAGGDVSDNNFGFPEDIIQLDGASFLSKLWEEYPEEKDKIADIYGKTVVAVFNDTNKLRNLKTNTTENNKLLAALAASVKNTSIDPLLKFKELGIIDPSVTNILIDQFKNVMGDQIQATGQEASEPEFDDVVGTFSKAFDTYNSGGDVSSVFAEPEVDTDQSTTVAEPPKFEWEPVTPPQIQGSKGAQSSVDGWAEGDPKKVVAWANNKFKATGMPKWQYMAMALVANHGLDPDLVPDNLIPKDLSDEFLKFKEVGSSLVGGWSTDFDDDGDGKETSDREPEIVNTPAQVPTKSTSGRSLDPTSPKYDPPTMGEIGQDQLDDKLNKLTAEHDVVHKELQALYDEKAKEIEAFNADDAKFDKVSNSWFDDFMATGNIPPGSDPDKFTNNKEKITKALADAIKAYNASTDNKWYDFKSTFAPQVTAQMKAGDNLVPNPNGIPDFSYEDYRAFAEYAKNKVGNLAPDTSAIDAKILPVKQKSDKLADQMAATKNAMQDKEKFTKIPQFDDGTPDPVPIDGLSERIKRVLQNWATSTGFGIGMVSNANGYGSYDGSERDRVMKMVKDTLSEKDPANVASHISNSVWETSLHPEQVIDLLKQVHRERKHPGSVVPKTTAKPADDGKKVSKSYNIVGPAVKKAGIEPSKFTPVSNVLKAALNNVSNLDAGAAGWHVRDQLFNNLNIPKAQAEALAKWVKEKIASGKKFDKDGKEIKGAVSASGAVAPANGNYSFEPKTKSITHAEIAKLNLPHPDAIYTQEIVPGEEVVIVQQTSSNYHGLELLQPVVNPIDDYQLSKASSAQAAERKKILSTSEYQLFTDQANAWQGSGQWSHSIQNRKKNNIIMSKATNGPPPALTKPLAPFVERGMHMKTNEDAEAFLSAFQIGKPVYLGPCGFSESGETARSFGGIGGTGCQILLRVYPRKDGMINATRLHHRPDGSATQSYNGEKELVLGTDRNLKVQRVVKRLVKGAGGHYGGGKYGVVYEIEMVQMEEGELFESINLKGLDIDKFGFKSQYWKGLDRKTIAALIKYMNCSVNTKW